MNIVGTPNLRRNLRLLEWMQHGVMALMWLINSDPNYYGNQPSHVVIKIVLWATTLTMSCFVPFQAPINYRRMYIFCNITVLMIGAFLGVGDGMLLYIALAKSCFLLSLREVIAIAAITGVTFGLSYLVYFPSYLRFSLAHLSANVARAQSDQGGLLLINIIYNLAAYVVASVFVISFAIVIIKEQHSRQQADRLAIEVETLAAALERDRIAREIHDSLGHSLMALQVQLELSERLHLQEPHQASKSLRVANQLALQCIKDVRLSVQGIRAIGHFDLYTSLQTLLAQTAEHQNLIVNQNLHLPKELPTQTSQQLYCIIQEGLTNIQKHARAQTITIDSDYDRQQLWLELQDDGQGFIDRADRQTGFGLRGMRERVQLIGGRLDIQSSIGHGTKIQVVIPYDSLAVS
jgi:signal transduction histidine kinase